VGGVLFFLFLFIKVCVSKQIQQLKQLEAEIKAEEKTRRKIEVIASRSERFIAAKSAEFKRKDDADWERRKRFRQSVDPLNADPTTTPEKQVAAALTISFHFFEATARKNKTRQRELSHVPSLRAYTATFFEIKPTTRPCDY
jgi:hypothetical protein